MSHLLLYNLVLTLYSYGCSPSNKTEYLMALDKTEEEFLEDPVINWDAMWWVDRPLELWVVHVILALISFIETILLLYLNYKASFVSHVASF